MVVSSPNGPPVYKLHIMVYNAEKRLLQLYAEAIHRRSGALLSFVKNKNNVKLSTKLPLEAIFTHWFHGLSSAGKRIRPVCPAAGTMRLNEPVGRGFESLLAHVSKSLCCDRYLVHIAGEPEQYFGKQHLTIIPSCANIKVVLRIRMTNGSKSRNCAVCNRTQLTVDKLKSLIGGM